MTGFAALNGSTLTGGSITTPQSGAWSGDVTITNLINVPTTGFGATVTLGNLTLVGTAYRQAQFGGVTTLRLVGGGGGWRKQVSAQQYLAAFGGSLSLSTVINDLAATVGERVTIDNDVGLGSTFVREAASAREVLNLLFGSGWWIDPTGLTHLGSRPGGTIQSQLIAEEWSGARGQFSIATEDYASWMPGASFSGPTIPTAQMISATTFVFDNDGRFRLDVLAADADKQDRIISPIDAVIQAAIPRQTYNATYAYVVQAVHGKAPAFTLDLVPGASTTLPSLASIPLRPSPAGQGSPTVGGTVSVAFDNADPTKPYAFNASGVDTIYLGAGVYPATEHVATVEGVVNMFINFLVFLSEQGDPSGWSGPGKIFFTAEPVPGTILTAAVTEWLANCALPSPIVTTGPTGGGMIPPDIFPLIASTLQSKLPDVEGFLPSLGSPEVMSG